jgi:hypothetical protein
MSDMPREIRPVTCENPCKHRGFVVELRGLEPLTPTLPARVIGQISCRPVPPDVTTSLYSLGFVPSRVAT